MKPKVAYFTNIAPHYREKLWLKLAKLQDVEFHFFFGYKPDQSIKSIDFTTEDWKDHKHQIHLLENIEVNTTLVYQKKVLREVLLKKWDAIVLLGHARNITSWLTAVVARLRGFPVIFWGHGLYGSEGYYKKTFLKTFLSLSNLVLVYGEWAKNLMLNEGIDDERVMVIYNSINYDYIKSLRYQFVSPKFYYNYFQNYNNTLIFIGRLTKNKKLDLLINAVSDLRKKGYDFNLMIIGEGSEMNALKKLSKELDINTYFYGACYNEEEIGKLLQNADLCISPGNVGLMAVHSMSYGTPVCSHNNFKNQGPEFEAIISGKTGCFYDKKKHNIDETILEWFEKAPSREEVRQNCFDVVDQKYNPNIQLNVMKAALDKFIN